MLDTAIIGLGRWGQNLVNAASGSDKIRFVSGVARNVERASVFAREHGIALGSDFDAAIADPAIRAVVIATPHSMHAQHVLEAASAGKHVFVEKPLALTTGDANAAEAACKNAGSYLAVDFNRRFLPAFIRLSEICASGAIGDPLHLEGNLSGPSGYSIPPGHWRGSTAENPAGGMAARGNHIVDAMVAICGPVEWVSAQSQRRVLQTEADDTTSALLRFESGVTGSLVTIMATAETWRLRVLGSKGWAEMTDENTIVTAGLKGEIETQHFSRCDTLRSALECFAEAVSGNGSFPVTPAQAIHGVAVTQAVQQAAFLGTRVSVREIG